MVTVTRQRSEPSTLDPHLFTFKPKLNEKSHQLADSLLTDFYERQLKHVQRLQELVSVFEDKYEEQEKENNSSSLFCFSLSLFPPPRRCR